MANKEMKTIQFPGSETVYEIVDNAAREALAGKQPSGDYATKTELAQGLASKQPTGDYATRTELSQGLAEKQPMGDYATRTELSQGLAEKQPTGDYATTEELNAGLELKQPIGDYVTRQELDEDLAKKQPVGDYVTNDELTSGLAEKQPVGDYATNTALTEGLASKQPMGDYATNTALAEGLATKQPVGNYALKSELPDVSGFITKSVSDLVNYYNKTEVDNKISTIPKFSIKVVDILPFDSISTTTIYLLKTPSGTNGDLYTEYIYVDGAWESLGTQTVDLSGYVTTEALNSAIADFVTAEYVSTALANYATTESLNAHTGNTNNPHGVTKSQVGLENVANERQYSSQNPPPYPVTSVAGRTGAVALSKTDVGLSNVDNTSDTNKPVSTAQATAIAEAKQAGTNAQNAIDTHAAQANNPHNVTAAQVGAYVKPVSGIPESDLSAEVQDKLNSGGGGEPTAENLLQSSVTANRQAGVAEGDMVNLGYALGLEEGKMYTVKYKFNGADIVATAKYEAPTGDMLTGATLALCQNISIEGMTMTYPILLGVQDYNASEEDAQTAVVNYGFLFIVDKHQITEDESYTADENNCSVYLRALQSENAQNAVNVEITSIEPFTEVVADKVKNPLTIGDVVFDGSSAKTVDLSEYAKTTGTYSDMTVGNAEKLNGKAASEYALMTIKTTTEWKSQNPVLAAGVFGFDSTSKIIKIGDGTTAWNALPAFATPHFTFATAEWADISRIAAAGDARKYFNVGDEKTIALSTGEAVTLVILGFNHDDLTSGGKAPITIGMKNLLATRYRMNSSNTNAGGWNNSRFRTSTMQLLLSEFPSDLQAVIKSVDKKATSGSASTTITTSSDKLFLFSEVEIDGTTESGYASEGEQYEYWKTIKDGKTSDDRIKYSSNGNGSAMTWWLRSPDVTNATDFCYIGSGGTVGFTDAVGTWGTCFGFCI